MAREAPLRCLSSLRFFFSLLLLLCFLSGHQYYADAQSLRTPVVYTGWFAAKLDSLLTALYPSSSTLYMRSIDVVSANGNDAVITLDISNNAGSTSTYVLRASLGCAAGQLEISLSNFQTGNVAYQCQEQGNGGISGLCESYLPEQCTGVFPYSTYQTLDGNYELQIHGLCSVQGDVYLSCQGSCTGTVQCSPFIQQTVIQGGTVNSNNSVVIINGGPTNATFNGGTLQIQTSNNFTIETPATDINVYNSSVTINTKANVTNLNTGPLRTCADWIDYNPVTGANFTLTATPLLISFTSASVDTGDGDSTWDVPDNSHVQYVSNLNGASYMFIYCMQKGYVYGAGQVEQLLELQVMNVTGGTPHSINSASFALSTTTINSTGAAVITSSCATFTTNAVKQNDLFALYMSGTYNGTGSTPPIILAPGAAFSLSAFPTGCVGNVNNITFNITVQFANGTLLKGGQCTNITTDSDDGSFVINNEGICSMEPDSASYPSTCLYFSTDGSGVATSHYLGVCAVDANSGTPFGGRISLHSSSSVNFTSLGGGNFTASVEQLTFTGQRCSSLTKSGSTVTSSGTEICSIATTSTCLAFNVNANGNVTATFEGMCGIVDTPTVSWAQPSPGIFAATCTSISSNGSTCVTCNGNGTTTINGTLEVDKLCAKTQCEVRADSPTSDTPFNWPLPKPCFSCSDGHNGDGGGGGDGGSGVPIIPIIPIIPLIPFFPPIIPPLVPVVGGVPGGGGGDPGNGLPVSPVPITTPLIGDPPITTGGIYIPYVNFTNAVPSCDITTKGSEVMDNSSLPDTKYVCQRLLNGTYAWTPYCPCSAAFNNGTVYYYSTSQLMANFSTLYLDSTSQLIIQGNTYLANAAIQNLIVNGTFTAANLAMCNNGELRSRYLRGCSAAPIADTGLSICNASHAIPFNFDSATNCLGGPPDFPNGITAESTSTISNLVSSTTAALNGVTTNNGNMIMASASSTTFNAGSFLDIASGVTMRRQPVAVTATTLAVTCNGKLCRITLASGLCDASWGSGPVCILTVSNSAITIATTAGRVDMMQLGSSLLPPVLSLNNLLSGSVDIILYCYGLACTATTQVVLLEIMN